MSHFKGLVQLAPCPKCGKKVGWFEKLICKYDQHYGAGGESEGTTDFVRVRGGERRFCMSSVSYTHLTLPTILLV